MSASRGKILVIRGGAIGDFILTLPAISALRQQFPGAHLEVLGYPHIVQLAIAGGLVDRAASIEARSLAGFFARDGELEPGLADYFSEFDIIVSYLYDPDQVFRGNVARCSTAQFIAAPHRPNEQDGIHATQVYLKPLERLAIFDADHVPRLSVRSFNPVPGQIALHPGSGSERKNWPESHWADLIEHLIHRTPLRLLLVGGEAEGDRLQRLAAALPPHRARVAQMLPLPELAGLLEQCALFIGHDSGISHLAAALGLPGIVLWGGTPQRIWRPPSDRIVILRDPHGLDHLEPGAVIEHLQQLTAL